MKTRKCFLILIIVFLIFQLPTTLIFAQTSDFTYELIDNGMHVSITGYSGSDTFINIPDSIDGKPVTSINDIDFGDPSIIKEINLPDTIISIDQTLFNLLTSLENISVKTSNPNYSSDGGILFNKDKTDLIRYPEGKSNADYSIPDGVTDIVGDAFFGAVLQNVIIPDTVINIGKDAFLKSNINQLSIPASVSFIDGNVSADSKISSIDVDSNNTNYSSIDGVLFNKDKTALITYPSARIINDYEIPDSVKMVSQYAFYYSKIANVSIPDSVTAIEDHAFSSSLIVFIKIPDSVTSIGESAFAYCFNLRSISIPAGMTTIKTKTFYGCTNLISAKLPYGITSIEDVVFYGCFKLASVNIPGSILSIGEGAFYGCSDLISIKIPGSVTFIGDYALSGEGNQFIIYGEKGSYIDEYSNNNDLPFSVLFPDISDLDWAHDAIMNLTYSDIISGYGDNTFRPNSYISRAEFAKLLVMAFNIYDSSAVTTFSDVSQEKWYYSYVSSAEKVGLARGTGDGLFNPDSEITREEMFTFCARAINQYKSYNILSKDDPVAEAQLSKFSDGSTVSDWAKGYVATITNSGLVTGSPSDDGYALNPKKPITRAEVAVVLDRAIKLPLNKLN